MTLNIKTSATVTLNFDKVQGLRDLEDTALSLSAYCKADAEILQVLQEVAGADFQGTWSLKPFETRLRGHGENLSVLTKRIGNTIELVSAEHWNNCVLALTQNLSDEVCVCTGFKESGYGCRNQQARVPTGKEDNQRHDCCKVDHSFDSGLSAC